jgi:toxin ParE1/3/4
VRHYDVRFSKRARTQLEELYDFLAERADPLTALRYVERIERFCLGFETFPERGSIRSDVRHGLRIVGFERRVSIAFVVEGERVTILQILYAGRRLQKG